jgi:nicotinate-nucleotide--dimethylbenzimidazole phosphoribosyltransferase
MDFIKQLEHKINCKTKPLGALGLLEELALQIGIIQNTLTPELLSPHILVFAGDHGIAREGVSAYPAEVTAQMVLNFLNGGAAINVFSRQHNLKLKIIDAGVNYDFTPGSDLRDCKIAKGTKNFLKEPAMSEQELSECINAGKKLVDEISYTGCNVIGFGEMGIGNTSSASMLMSSICRVPIEECVGRGTGLTDEKLRNKIRILKQAQANHPTPGTANEALKYFGGFEIAQMCGAMLQAFRNNMIILVDGFIATSAFLSAHSIRPGIIRNAVFCQQSDEQGHKKMLEYLGVKPLLHLQTRLGEGIGCALAYPLLQSSVNFLNEMSSFEEAGVRNKES